ncbi:N-acetyltransferase [Arenibacter aquaticus]|uniref:N-acetyltransferase n=1 Tax=Arenibacter aquaticus TaxID=2489054 RepID=A0A3S0D603_9FLAO|nr:GNAT family N-acetyltransferase [Arenibacter aquaticus]RTE53786.1 N-acetyltransferase [Arenibacter aquaticus]
MVVNKIDWVELKVLKNEPDIFFRILPEEWQKTIGPVWEDCKENGCIYVLRNAAEIMAGGIVFIEEPPNRTQFEIENGAPYLALGYYYIGFLFVGPNYRNQSMGSKWLEAIKNKYPDRSFWLTIEEEGLRYFYEKNGFKCVAESQDPSTPEWMFVYTSDQKGFKIV